MGNQEIASEEIMRAQQMFTNECTERGSTRRMSCSICSFHWAELVGWAFKLGDSEGKPEGVTEVAEV